MTWLMALNERGEIPADFQTARLGLPHRHGGRRA